MASSKEFVLYVTEQVDGLTARQMMGDYVLYYHDKVVGGIYDNRLLVKPTSQAKILLENAEYQKPYDGAKEMLLVENLEDREGLEKLFETISQELLDRKRKGK